MVRTSNILVFKKNIFNPNSHSVFFVSRLTAVGHMRHPFKADLGEKWRRLRCLCVHPSARTRPAKWFKTERRSRIFYVFRYNFACRPPIWILKRLPESSEHDDSKSMYYLLFEFLLLKASKVVKTTFRFVCVCESQPFLLVRQSPEKKFGLLK